MVAVRPAAGSRRPAAGLLPAATALLTVVLLLSATAAAANEPEVRSEVNALGGLVWQDDNLYLSGSSHSTLDIRSAPDPMVKGRLQLRFFLYDDPLTGTQALLDVPRASIRFRFPVTESWNLRVTAGRDRLSWGIGRMFNAADLLFGADGRDSADLTRTDDLRDETAWLLSAYFPLGDLGYLETAVLPPLAGIGSAAAALPPIATTRAGGRLHLVAGPFSLEPAYLYDGDAADTGNNQENALHRVAFSLQSTLLGADLYAAARGDLSWDDDPDFRISAGIVRSFTPTREQTLTPRLEGLIDPAAPQELLLYPEIIWSPGRITALLARATVIPHEPAADITLGATWNIFQGFSALLFASTRTSSETYALSGGFRYQF